VLIHTLNRDHVAAPAVLALARLRAELFERIGRTVAAWAVPAVNLSLFGSTARGDGDLSSDIDLLLVRPPEADTEEETWDDQRDTLSEDVWRWTGNHAAIIDLPFGDLPELVRRS
jgi:predicted nucleotidyltransferase